MCFFPLDIALVPVSSHGASDILPCELYVLLSLDVNYNRIFILFIIGYYAVHTFGCTHILIIFIYMEIILEMIYKPQWLNGTAK